MKSQSLVRQHSEPQNHPRQHSKTPTHLRSSACLPAVAILAIALGPALMAAQQPYPNSPNDNYGNRDPYAQPTAPGPYEQPQYAQPQPPQYAPPQQPQYGYAQPSPQAPYPTPDQPYPQPDPGQPAAPVQSLSAQDLEQLLAPISLYPDALLAQILTASTYPAQVAVADQWLQQMRAQGYNAPDQIAAGADAQTDWDPSVKALTAFPDVLDMLNHNLEWTTALGNAYFNQPQDVMQTVQVLRERAEQAGNLQSTPQEEVNNDQGYIQLAPTNPEMVYVPTYNPWVVYGGPMVPYPGFSLVGALGAFFGAFPVRYGLCFALGAFERFPFGWLSWGFDWLGHAVMFHHAGYFTMSASVRDWGLARGGPRAYNGWWRQNARAPGGYNRGYERGYNNGYNGSHPAGMAQGYGQRGSSNGYAQGRPAEPYRQAPSNSYNRGGYQQPGYGATRPALPGQGYERTAPQTYAYRPQTYPNRPQTYSSPNSFSRPQTYSTPNYGYGSSNRPMQAYANRPGYSNPYGSYRAPEPNPSRAFGGRSPESYGGYARNESSGGLRGFGNEKAPRSFGGERAPKNSFSQPRGFGGGGGHFSAPKAPKESHSGGGGGGHHHR